MPVNMVPSMHALCADAASRSSSASCLPQRTQGLLLSCMGDCVKGLPGRGDVLCRTCRGVLGNRRPGADWGGSVLDSVMGAFLTQALSIAPCNKMSVEQYMLDQEQRMLGQKSRFPSTFGSCLSGRSLHAKAQVGLR